MQSRYIERFAQAILTIFLVASLAFGMIRLLPGGPMDYLKAQLIQQQGSNVDMVRINRMVSTYTNVNPKEPVLDQYISYMTSLAQGDLGQSIWFNKPVSEILIHALPWTLFIMSVSIILSFAIGITLGALMAYGEGSRLDYVGSVISIFLNSVPYYVLALVLVYFLGYQFHWLPTGGRMANGTNAGLNWPFIAGVFSHATLPIMSLVITGFGGWALNMRGNSIQELGADYLRVARLRGLSSRSIALEYVGRNAILPMYTGLLINIGFLFGGSVILEQIFKYPGVGYYLFKSISSRDYPLMMGAFLVITIAVVIGVYIADLTYGLIDPRVGGGDSETY
ncbi:ABC transporter permease [Haladaptatus sp. R4]|uniref:ABC transporter permease n=1 Tax=Haladaptatus sp. R4 TaxID=1679489 RepID=UPI0007B4A222|nr:ABC transporter permease [Haladaptatus sp. R4]KZN22596.1 ABC transporter permease [Haladaptatus sp. R4]